MDDGFGQTMIDPTVVVAEAEKVTAETVKGEWPQAAPRLYFLETDTTFSAVGKFLESGKDTFPD